MTTPGETRTAAAAPLLARWIAALVAIPGAGGLGCGADDVAAPGDVPTETGPDADADSPGEADAEAGADADSPGEADAEAGADGDVTSDGGGGGGPALLYSGPRDDGAVVAGWDPGRPRPLIVECRYEGSDVWNVTMAEIAETGVVGGMLPEHLRVWGWGDFDAEAPALLFEGPLDGSARIPGWNAADPLPVIVLTRYAGATTWFLSMATIDETGLVGGPVTDEVKVWGWTSGALGAPRVVYEGPRDAEAVVPGWSTANPLPLLVLTKYAATAVWFVSMAEVDAAGAVGGMVSDWLRVWGW